MNYVAAPPSGLVIALQYWPGDEVRAMRLARLIADIEPKRRDDVALFFCRRHDMVTESALAWETWLHCAQKFRVGKLRSRREGEGHPRGCNELWSGVMDQLSEGWWAGRHSGHSVFTIEADGCPLRADWIDIIAAEQDLALKGGKRVTGALMNRGFRHINGSLVAHFSLWQDRPSLHRTPSDQAWDLFHAGALLTEARPTTWIKNVYGAKGWTPGVLEPMSKETAWLSNTKDDSAIEWAESELAERLDHE